MDSSAQNPQNPGARDNRTRVFRSNRPVPDVIPPRRRPVNDRRAPQQNTDSNHQQQGGRPQRHLQARALTPHQKDGGQNNGGSPRPAGRSRPPMRRPMPSRGGDRMQKPQAPDVIPPLAWGDIRIIPLGGVEEIQKNMTMVEYKDQIIVIDAGTKFGDADTPGVNALIPDTKYLEERKHLIKALVITHGHLDHIGGIPYVMDKLGNPPIYTREFGAVLIQKRQEEFPQNEPLNIVTVDKEDGAISVSDDLKVRFFGLTHAIPDSTGVIIETPHGDIVSTGDVRVDNFDGIPTDKEKEQYKIFKDRNVLLMTMDSTGIPSPGWSISETVVTDTIDKIIRDTKGRLIIATFASQVERIIEFIRSAKKYGKFVVVEGRSMKTNISIVQQLNLTELDHVIDVEDMPKHPPNKIVMLATGAQGEEFAALDRMSRDIHKFVKLTESDTIVFSSSVIPGNDRAVDRLKDLLYRKNPLILTYADTQVHASGHGRRAELEWIHTQIKYKYFMPIHGSHFRLKMHRDMVVAMGFNRDNIIVPDNGTIVEIRKEGTELVQLKERAPHNMVIIDGSYIGDMHAAVIRDRKTLSEEGFFTIVAVLDARTKRLKKSPDIISRGSVYLRENQELLQRMRILIKRTIEDAAHNPNVDPEEIKEELAEKVGRLILQKTHKRPVLNILVLAF
jgi:ribonuclease J